MSLPSVGSGKPTMKRYRIAYKFHHARLRRQGNDLVASNSKVPSRSLLIFAQNDVHEVENLLHHRILAQIVITFSFKLRLVNKCFRSPSSMRTNVPVAYIFGHRYPRIYISLARSRPLLRQTSARSAQSTRSYHIDWWDPREYVW
jgi:hypothetical protein